MKEPLTFSISFTKAREEFGDETLCPEEEDLQFVEKSAYDDLKAKLEIAREALDSLSSSTHHRNIADEQELRQRTKIASQALKQIGEE